MISVCLRIAQKQMMNFNVFVERELAIKWAPCAISSRSARGENDTDNDENESARFSRTGTTTYYLRA